MAKKVSVHILSKRLKWHWLNHLEIMGIRVLGSWNFPTLKGPQEQSCPKGPKLACSATGCSLALLHVRQTKFFFLSLQVRWPEKEDVSSPWPSRGKHRRREDSWETSHLAREVRIFPQCCRHHLHPSTNFYLLVVIKINQKRRFDHRKRKFVAIQRVSWIDQGNAYLMTSEWKIASFVRLKERHS